MPEISRRGGIASPGRGGDIARVIEDGEARNAPGCRLESLLMDDLTAFGLFAVTAMLVCYALEDRSHWFILAFAGACALGSAYGFLQGAWPFGLIEAIWTIVAGRRWVLHSK